MTKIRSTWTLPSPPPLTGLLTAAEWSGAATMPIPLGTLLAQNDANNLYIGLDITSETGAPSTNDYFQFMVDINGNGVIDANRDIAFGIIQGALNTLVRVYMLGPDEETGVPPGQVIPSKLQSGFGASLNSATPHRQWQIAFALSDLGIDPIDPAGPSPVVDFGLLIGTIGGVEDAMPADVWVDFSALSQIVLACTPTVPVSGLVGPVIATIGVIGTGDIAPDGYCTVVGNYPINPVEAAFCGTMSFIGNVATLTYMFNVAGATKYQVLHRYGATPALASAAAFAPIFQSWGNFEIEGVNDVWQSFGPDASGYYPFVNPAIPYTIQNLLFQWTSSGEPDGSHQFQINFFNASNNPVALPPGVLPQVLTMELDNQPPIVDLTNILFAGSVVSPCTIVNLTAADPGVQLQFEAYDPEGDLLSMTLTAEWGHGNVSNPPIYSDTYSAHANAQHIWQGVQTDTQPPAVTGWIPPQSCAYLFQIEATTRTTNGYTYPVVYATDFQTITLVKPSGIPIIHPPIHVLEEKLNVLPKSTALAGPKHKHRK